MALAGRFSLTKKQVMEWKIMWRVWGVGLVAVRWWRYVGVAWVDCEPEKTFILNQYTLSFSSLQTMTAGKCEY